MSHHALAGTWLLVGLLLAGLAGFSFLGGPSHLISDAEIARAASAQYQVPSVGAFGRQSLAAFEDYAASAEID